MLSRSRPLLCLFRERIRILRIALLAGVLGFAAGPVAADEPYRGGDDPHRFMASGDRVLDRSTGLTWQRCSFGQRWSPDLGCVGLARKVWFSEAQALETADWRLPSLQELQALVDPPSKSGLDPIAFPDAPAAWNWATGPGGAAAVWGPPCDEQLEFACSRGSALAVRLVLRHANRGKLQESGDSLRH